MYKWGHNYRSKRVCGVWKIGSRTYVAKENCLEGAVINVEMLGKQLCSDVCVGVVHFHQRSKGCLQPLDPINKNEKTTDNDEH